MTKKETMQVVHVRLPESQINALDAIAKDEMGSRGQEIRKAVRKHIEQHQQLHKDRPKEDSDD